MGWIWGGSVTATTFPQSVGLGETWDAEILRQAIGPGMRVRYVPDNNNNYAD